MSGEWRRNAKVYQESSDFKSDKIDKKYKRNNRKKENNKNNDNRNNDYRNNDRNNDYRNNDRNNDYRNNDRKNDYRNKNNDYRNKNNDYRNKNNNEKNLENKNTINKIIVNTETMEDYKPISNYLEKCKIKQEEDSKKINLKNPEYWRGNIWIGPKYLKHNKGQSLYNKINLENINCSTIVIPGRILYSRNNEDWYSSWKETFTDEEWLNMEQQEAHEELMKSAKIYSEFAEKQYLKRKKESDEYYYQTGELDAFGQVEKEHEEYEKYLERLEKEEKEYQEMEEMMDEESDNGSIILSDDDYMK